MNEQKPSAMAMRIAEKLDLLNPTAISIIDREIASLVEALELAREALDSMMGDTDLPFDDSLEMEAMQAISAALAKYREGE